MPSILPVIIIGAGPAGLAAAAALHQRGVQPLVLEAKHQGRSKVCGGFLNPAVLSCSQLSPLISHVIAQVPKNEISSLTLSTSRKTKTFALGSKAKTVCRKTLDESLWKSVAGAGIKIQGGEPVTAITRDSSHWLVQTTQESYAADCVILATGLNDTLVPSGLSDLKGNNRRVGIQFTLKPEGVFPHSIGLHFGPWGYSGSCLMGDGLVDCSAVVPVEILRKYGNAEKIWAMMSHTDTFLRQHGSRMQLLNSQVISRVSPRRRKLQLSQFMTCGDALQFFEPFTGQGIWHALYSGNLAGHRMADALDYVPWSQTLRKMESAHREFLRSFSLNLKLAPLLGYPCAAEKIVDAAMFVPSVVQSMVSCVLVPKTELSIKNEHVIRTV